MWKIRGKIYMCSDPNYVISSVGTFKFVNNIDKLNSHYKIDAINSDSTYKDLYSFYSLMEGYDFIPVCFSDKLPRLGSLDKKFSSSIELHWCIGYVSPYLKNGNKGILSYSRHIDLPSYELLLSWLKYHVDNYDSSTDIHINQVLAKICLRQYLEKIRSDLNISKERFFNLVNNNSVLFIKRGTCKDWIEHLELLPTRDKFEIIVNEFE